MTRVPIPTMWKRNARGYYEYEIRVPDGTDKDQLKDAMQISTELDKTIDAAIQEMIKFKAENQKKKREAAAALKKMKKSTEKPPSG